MIKKIFKKESGFTLLETLVAIAILALVIAAVMGMVQLSLVANANAKDRLIAKYLAEEGVEYVRHMRDMNTTNYQEGSRDWLYGIASVNTDPCGVATANNSYTCDVDPVNSTLTRCGTSNTQCTALNTDLVTSDGTNYGKYSHSSGGNWTPSKFSRTITITGVDSNGSGGFNSAKVDVVIRWNENSGPQSFTVDDYLFHWEQL